MTLGLKIEKPKILSIYSFTKGGASSSQQDLVLPQQAVGSFWASYGLTVKGQAGPTGN